MALERSLVSCVTCGCDAPSISRRRLAILGSVTTTDDSLAPLGADSNWTGQRRAVLESARAMHRLGLVSATSGNVSARCRAPDGGDALTITATGCDYESMGLDDVVVVDFDGEPLAGEAVPSTETLMHAAVYRARPDVGRGDAHAFRPRDGPGSRRHAVAADRRRDGHLPRAERRSDRVPVLRH